VLFIFRAKLFFFWISFFSFSESAESVAPNHVLPIAPLGQAYPVPECNRNYPCHQPGISPAALCMRAHFDPGV
jgi:hypothetical protein